MNESVWIRSINPQRRNSLIKYTPVLHTIRHLRQGKSKGSLKFVVRQIVYLVLSNDTFFTLFFNKPVFSFLISTIVGEQLQEKPRLDKRIKDTVGHVNIY